MFYPFISENVCRTLRHEFYNSFESRKDLSMELLDALTAESNVNSAINLSLSHHFTRQHSSISQLISEILTEEALSSALQNIYDLVMRHIYGQEQGSKKARLSHLKYVDFCKIYL